MAAGAGTTQKRLPVTIAAGASLSTVAGIGDHIFVGYIMPAVWTAAPLTFQVSDDAGVTWNDLYDDTGAEVKATATTAGRRIAILNLAPFAGVTFLKVRSGTGAAPVNQTAAAVLQIVTRALNQSDQLS
jgi:hypothetical protein